MSTDSSTAPGRVVVGVDGSAHSLLALRWGAALAAATGGQLDVVMAWHQPVYCGWDYVAIGDWNPARDAAQRLDESVRAVFGEDRPAGLRLLVREGNAAQVLRAASRDAAMLVVGSRGRGGVSGLLLGSVSANCAEHATCPVLVVHGTRAPATLIPPTTPPTTPPAAALTGTPS